MSPGSPFRKPQNLSGSPSPPPPRPTVGLAAPSRAESFTGLAQPPAASSGSEAQGCGTVACGVAEQALNSGEPDAKAHDAPVERLGKGKEETGPGGPPPHTPLGCFRRLQALLLPPF